MNVSAATVDETWAATRDATLDATVATVQSERHAPLRFNDETYAKTVDATWVAAWGKTVSATKSATWLATLDATDSTDRGDATWVATRNATVTTNRSATERHAL